jgi:flagellar motor switch protein FliN/FliY
MSEDKGRLDLQDLGAAHAARGVTPGADPAAPRAQEPCAPLADKPPAARGSDDLGAVYDIPVQLSAVLGKASMPVSQLLRLGRGAVVELDRKVGESIDILVNNRLVARGEVVVLDDRLGVTMTEIIKSEP